MDDYRLEDADALRTLRATLPEGENATRYGILPRHAAEAITQKLGYFFKVAAYRRFVQSYLREVWALYLDALERRIRHRATHPKAAPGLPGIESERRRALRSAATFLGRAPTHEDALASLGSRPDAVPQRVRDILRADIAALTAATAPRAETPATRVTAPP